MSPFADTVRSSHLFLLSFALIGVAAGTLFYTGAFGRFLGHFARAVRTSEVAGFRIWERYLSWASWPVFLAVEIASLWVGVATVVVSPTAAVAIGLVPLLMGIVACLAYMHIDVERYEVERGYKATHDLQHGQRLATELTKYDHQVRVPLLLAAACGAVGGFSLLNFGLAEGLGHAWYIDAERGAFYADFLVYSLINLYRVVDLFDLINVHNWLGITPVRPAAWPSSVLLTMFTASFTLVLLQQIFASIRKGRVMAETISDFWSPHEPIHLRARSVLPKFGRVAVWPLLESLRRSKVMTQEQRDQLSFVLAALGPSAVRPIAVSLRDPIEHVRAVAIAALGRMRATDLLPALCRLIADPSDLVRLSLAEALGTIAIPTTGPPDRRGPRPSATAPDIPVGWLWFWRARSAASDPVNRVVVTLRAALSDAAVAVQARAAVSLGKLGPAAATATEDLIARLADGDETVRCCAALALGQVAADQPAALVALIELLSDPSPDVQEAAARAVTARGGDTALAVPALVPLLQNGAPDVRQAAAEAIRRSGPLSAATSKALTAGLSSPDNVVRAQAAAALGTIGSAAGQTASALVALLTDENDRVRAEAVTALSKIGPAASMAVPELMRALRDEDNWVSALAALALGEMGPSAEGAVPALASALRHPNPQVRGQAAEALGRLGPAAAGAVPALSRAADDADGSVRALVVRALGTAGRLTPVAAGVLRAGLSDEDPRVRAAAVEALGRVGEPEESLAADVLRLLQDPNDLVKAEAALALPRLAAGSSAAVLVLSERLMVDDSVWVQASAARALGRMGAASVPAGPALVSAAQTAELSVRTAAMRALALVQPPEAPVAFAGGLSDADPDVRILASAGWRKTAFVPDVAVGVLVLALEDSEERVRANAAYALARLAELPAEAITTLTALATDPADRVRLAVTLALRASPDASIAPLTLLLDDPNLRVRTVAAGTLLANATAGSRARDVMVEALASDVTDIHRAAVSLVARHHTRAGDLVPELRERAGDRVSAAVWAEVTERVASLTAKSPQVAVAAPAAEAAS